MAKMISSKDRHKLQMGAFLAGFILLCVCVFVGTRYIPFKWLGLALLALEILVLMPQVCKLHNEMHGRDVGISAYIPGLNIVQTFTRKCAMATLVVGGLVAVCGVAVAIPSWVFLNVFGEVFAMDYKLYCMNALYFSSIAATIVIGIGYNHVMTLVHYKNFELFDSRAPYTSLMWRVLLYVPLLRGCGLVYLFSQLKTLQGHDYGAVRDYRNEYYQEQEDF